VREEWRIRMEGHMKVNGRVTKGMGRVYLRIKREVLCIRAIG